MSYNIITDLIIRFYSKLKLQYKPHLIYFVFTIILISWVNLRLTVIVLFKKMIVSYLFQHNLKNRSSQIKDIKLYLIIIMSQIMNRNKIIGVSQSGKATLVKCTTILMVIFGCIQ